MQMQLKPVRYVVKETEIIWGQESIQEGVLNYEFSLSPRAFYQLNPEQTEVLYSRSSKSAGC